MHNTEYAYPATSVRIKENLLLKTTDLEQLINMRTVEAAAAYLSSKGWHVPADKSRDTSAILRSELLFAWDFLNEVAPDITILYPLIIRKDFHNLKAGIKSVLSGAPADKYFLSPCTIPHELMSRAASKREFSILPEPFASVGEEAYDSLVRTGDGQLSDLIIDNAALCAISESAKKTGNALLIKTEELFCAAANIKTAFRAARMGKDRAFLNRAISTCGTVERDKLISEAASGESALIAYLEHTEFSDAAAALKTSPAFFEKWCDNRAIEYLADVKYITFGPEPLIAYYLAKEAEIKNVRILLAAVENDLPYDKIKDRLRRLYE